MVSFIIKWLLWSISLEPFIFKIWMALDGCFWTVLDSFFWSNSITLWQFFQLVLFYNVTRNIHLIILKPAMLEHTLYRISTTASRIRNWVPQLTIVSIVQSPAPRLQHLEPSVQSPAFRLQRPTLAFRVQGSGRKS